MKIALCGTTSSGKTTLANKLTEYITDSVNVGSIARLSPFPINEEVTLESQIWIAVTRIQKELEASKKYSNVINERSVLDDYAYFLNLMKKSKSEFNDDIQYLWVGNRKYLGTEIYPIEIMLEKMYKLWFTTYDHVFYLEPLPIVQDGTRSTNQIFADDIDKIIKDLLETQQDVHRLPAVSLEQRVKLVLDRVLK